MPEGSGDSGASSRTAETGPAGVFGKSYAAIAQDMVEYLAWAQIDATNTEGGWSYYSSGSNEASNDLTLWPVLGIGAAEQQMGSTAPVFVRQELPYWLQYDQVTAATNLNGSWGLFNTGMYTDDGRTGDGLVQEAFTYSNAASRTDVQAGIGFLYRQWNPNYANTDTCRGANLGWAGAMYRISAGLVHLGVSQVAEWNYTTQQPTGNSFDWYYTPPGQLQEGYAHYLIGVQLSDGSWQDSASHASACDISGDEVFTYTSNTKTALDLLILMRDGVPLPAFAPTNVVASVGSSAVNLTWNAPASPGSLITHYDITCTDTSTGNSTGCPTGTFQSPGPAGSAQISGLTDGDTYTFIVTPVNGAGPGTPSLPSNAVTIPKPTASRLASSRVSLHAGTLTFTWRVPSLGGIAGFAIYAGTHRLNAQLIRAHASRTYTYRVRSRLSGPYFLHVLLVGGGQTVAQIR